MKVIDNPFRKVGFVLLGLGVIDIFVMAYCISKEVNYSSSFNIFSVIAGLLLLKGSIKAAYFIRWFSLFFIVVFTSSLLLYPISMPIELLKVYIKLESVRVSLLYLFGVIFIAFLFWLYFQLSSSSSLAVLAQANYKTTQPKSALYLAFTLLIILIFVFFIMLNSDSAKKAKILAEEQLGSNYKYHISSLSLVGDSGVAYVTAYNAHELMNIQVKW